MTPDRAPAMHMHQTVSFKGILSSLVGQGKHSTFGLPIGRWEIFVHSRKPCRCTWTQRIGHVFPWDSLAMQSVVY